MFWGVSARFYQYVLYSLYLKVSSIFRNISKANSTIGQHLIKHFTRFLSLPKDFVNISPKYHTVNFYKKVQKYFKEHLYALRDI